VVEVLCRVAGSLSPTDDPRAELIRLRDVALLECLRSSGLQDSEAVSLCREHFNLADPSAVVRGKGGKDRGVFFSQAAVGALRAYWLTRGDGSVTRHTGSLPAFARHNGPVQGKALGLTAQGVRYIVEELRKRAGGRLLPTARGPGSRPTCSTAR
jgi:site-specific recombinase XerD